MKKYYRSQLLSQYPKLIQAFTTKHYGNLSWQTAKTEEKWDETSRAQAQLCADLAIPSDSIVTTFQNHSKNVIAIEARSRLSVFPADGLVTNLPNTALMVHTADCVPIMFFDPLHNAIGLVHAGWRGLVAGICTEAILRLQEKYDSHPQDIIACVGPGIGPCHFEVQDDVWSQFAAICKDSKVFEQSQHRKFLNLWLASREQLQNIGLKPQNIEVLGACTYCDDDFSSFRRDGFVAASMGSLIYLKS